MGHYIHAIVAPRATAESISAVWPELPRLELHNGFVVFPVDAESIDTRIAPDITPRTTGDEFMLLTDGFQRLLQAVSSGGCLAYIETEYFGVTGGQGALVYKNGIEVMPPTWRSFGSINDALGRIGMEPSKNGDQFCAARFDTVRDNDGILDLIAQQKTQPGG